MPLNSHAGAPNEREGATRKLTWGPKQQNSLAGASQAAGGEKVRKLEGQLHRLPQSILGPVQRAHIRKATACFL